MRMRDEVLATRLSRADYNADGETKSALNQSVKLSAGQQLIQHSSRAQLTQIQLKQRSTTLKTLDYLDFPKLYKH